MDIVFVHLGTPLPRYLKRNLERFSKYFPDHNLHLISDSVESGDLIGNANIYRPKPQPELTIIQEKLQHPRNFRGNFWFHAIARFLYLNQFIGEIGRPIMHFESDILVSKDFPFENFKVIKSGIAFPIVSQKRGIASTIYFAEESSARLLCNVALDLAGKDPMTSDMLILRAFYDKYSEKVQVLPISPAGLSNFKADAERKLVQDISNAFTEFGGVIDGHDLGVYFYGTDPRNARGVMTQFREVEENILHSGKWKLIWNPNREFVDLVDAEGLPSKVFSLHLTSKSPQAFSWRSTQKYLSQATKQDFLHEKRSFVWNIAIKQAGSALKRRVLPGFRQ